MNMSNSNNCIEVQSYAEIGLTRVKLNRPAQGNALSSEMVAELQVAMVAATNNGTRLLLLEGSGKNFCTGFDLTTLEQESDDTLLARIVRIELLLATVYAAPFTTLALGHGRAIGAGADLFLACEQRWAVDHANFAFPGAAFGLVLGTGRLSAAVGMNRAREWITSGATLSAETALASGLATAKYAATEVEPAILSLAARASRLAPDTQAQIHSASRQGGSNAANDLEHLVQSAARPGLKKRIQAFRASASRR